MRITPKYKQIGDQLRQLISTGAYPPNSCLPPELELARQLGVGRNTLLHAMNDLIRDGLIVRRRGSGSYIAPIDAPPLFPGKNLKIGILWNGDVDAEKVLTNFSGMMTRGALSVLCLSEIHPEWPRTDDHDATRAEWTARSQGLKVVALGESRYSQVRHPPLQEVRNECFDGILCISIIENEWLDQLLRLSIPTVLVDELDERFELRADQVFADPHAGYRTAVKQLISDGCKRIHFMGQMMSLPAPSPEMSHEQVAEYRSNRAPRVDPDSYLRLNAYRQAMHECGLPVSDDQVHFPADIPFGVLAERLISLPPDRRPDAVVCHGPIWADGLVEEFARRGQRLRAACAISGGYGGPALPIFANGAEMGATAAELLISRLHRPSRLTLRVGVPMVCKGSSTSNCNLHKVGQAGTSAMR